MRLSIRRLRGMSGSSIREDWSVNDPSGNSYSVQRQRYRNVQWKRLPSRGSIALRMETQHPDVLAGNLFDLDPAAVIAAAQRQRQHLKHPPVGVG